MVIASEGVQASLRVIEYSGIFKRAFAGLISVEGAQPKEFGTTSSPSAKRGLYRFDGNMEFVDWLFLRLRSNRVIPSSPMMSQGAGYPNVQYMID